ncbi:MAG: hypothetical protein WB239_09380 [Acidimicrobiia bacterium]
MQAPITPRPPATGVGTETSATFRLPRRHLAPFRVTLRPLFELSDLDRTTGFLAHASRSGDPVDTGHSPAILRWTVEAVDLLQPMAMVAFTMPPEAVLDSAFAHTTRSLASERLLLVFESARVGQRRQLLEEATRAAHRRGMRVALTGQRVRPAEGFDAAVVQPGSASEFLRGGGGVTIIATDLRTDANLDWARKVGADLVEGPLLADPMEVVPVDVGRQKSPSLNGDRALAKDTDLAGRYVDHGGGRSAG